MIMRSVVYGLSGMCMEAVFTGILSLYKGDRNLTGKTYLWMFPIYASAVFLEPVQNHIGSLPVFIRGMIYLTLIWGFEFISGWVIKRITGSCPWDYKKSTKHSFCGFIRWDYAPNWFLVGLLFEKYHEFLVTVFQ